MNNTSPHPIALFNWFTQNPCPAENEEKTSLRTNTAYNVEWANYFAQAIPNYFLKHFTEIPLYPCNEFAREAILNVLETASTHATPKKVQKDFQRWGMGEIYKLCIDEPELLQDLYFLMLVNQRSPTLLAEIGNPYKINVWEALVRKTPPEKIDWLVTPFSSFMLHHRMEFQTIKPYLDDLLKKTSDREAERLITPLLIIISGTQLHAAIDTCLDHRPALLVSIWPQLNGFSVWQEFSPSDKQNLIRKFALASPEGLCVHWYRYCCERQAFLFSEKDPAFHLEIAQTLSRLAPEAFLKAIFQFGGVPFEQLFDLMMKGMQDKPIEILRKFAKINLEHQKRLFSDCLQNEEMFKDPRVLLQILREKDGLSLLINYWKTTNTEGRASAPNV